MTEQRTESNLGDAVIGEAAHLGLNLETSRRALHEYLLGNLEAESELQNSLIDFDNYHAELVSIMAGEAVNAPVNEEGSTALGDLQIIYQICWSKFYNFFRITSCKLTF